MSLKEIVGKFPFSDKTIYNVKYYFLSSLFTNQSEERDQYVYVF